jgi:recombinational DNA repair protein RecR
MTPLAQLLARLPRVGEATAARLAQAIADQPGDYREALARAIAAEAPGRCPVCRDVPEAGGACRCQDPALPRSPILVVSTPAVRRSVCRAWRGQCHVLGGRDNGRDVPYVRDGALSLVQRCRDPEVRAVVLALGDPETEQAVADALRPLGLDVWAIGGQGLQWGRALEDQEPAEIALALTNRRPL